MQSVQVAAVSKARIKWYWTRQHRRDQLMDNAYYACFRSACWNTRCNAETGCYWVRLARALAEDTNWRGQAFRVSLHVWRNRRAR